MKLKSAITAAAALACANSSVECVEVSTVGHGVIPRLIDPDDRPVDILARDESWRGNGKRRAPRQK